MATLTGFMAYNSRSKRPSNTEAAESVFKARHQATSSRSSDVKSKQVQFSGSALTRTALPSFSRARARGSWP